MKIMLIDGSWNGDSDPSHGVSELFSSVLEELEVDIHLLTLDEKTPNMNGLSLLLDEVDGVIICGTTKWVGAGSILQAFLDNCYNLRPDFFREKYGLIVASAMTSGEDELLGYLHKCWQALGGYPPETLAGLIMSKEEIQHNGDIRKVLEKKLEDFYRIINQKRTYLPRSAKKGHSALQASHSVEHKKLQGISRTEEVAYTPKVQEFKQTPVVKNMNETQQDDVLEISQLFQSKLQQVKSHPTMAIIIQGLKNGFNSSEVIMDMIISFNVTGIKPLHFTVDIKDKKLMVEETMDLAAQIHITLDEKFLFQILDGTLSLQNAFVLGKASVKGKMSLLALFDQCFKF